MQTVRTILIILICAALLGACGLRGPLYLEDENPVPTTASEQDPAPVMDDTENPEEDKEEEKKKTVFP